MGTMYRRRVLQTTGSIVGLGALGANTALANDNRRRNEAELVELSPGDIEVQTSDPDASNFEEEFTYYVVRFGFEYDEAEYREPARTGPEVFGLGGSGAGAFWFGVSAPDGDGIQHEVQHRGQVSLYLRVGDEWREIRAQFNGRGELVNVNGVRP